VKTSTIIAWLVFLTELTIFALVREVRDVVWSWLFGDVLFRGRRITFVNVLEDVVQARATLRAQHTPEVRRQRADVVIRNDGDLSELEAAVRRAWNGRVETKA